MEKHQRNRSALLSALVAVLTTPGVANAFDFSSAAGDLFKSQGTKILSSKLPDMKMNIVAESKKTGTAGGAATGEGYKIADQNAFVSIANEKRAENGLQPYGSAGDTSAGPSAGVKTTVATSAAGGLDAPSDFDKLKSTAGAAWDKVGGAQGVGALATTITGDAKWATAGMTVNSLGNIGSDKSDLQNLSNLTRAVGSGVLINDNNRDNLAAKIAVGAGTLGNAAFAKNATDMKAVYGNMGGLQGIGNSATVITGEARYTAYGQAGAAIGNIKPGAENAGNNMKELARAGSAIVLSNDNNRGGVAGAVATAGLAGAALFDAVGAGKDVWQEQSATQQYADPAYQKAKRSELDGLLSQYGGNAAAAPTALTGETSPYADPAYQKAKRAELDSLLANPWKNAPATPMRTDANQLMTGEVLDRVSKMAPEQQAFFNSKGMQDLNASLASINGITDPSARAAAEAKAINAAVLSAEAVPVLSHSQVTAAAPKAALKSVGSKPKVAKAEAVTVDHGPRAMTQDNRVAIPAPTVRAPVALPDSNLNAADRAAQAQWGDLMRM